MTRIVGISGSLRRASLNAALLRAAVQLMPAEATLEVATIEGVPLYNGDDELATGVPPEAAAMKEAIASADGVLVVTPEYNNGIPGVFKNAIDWMSRGPGLAYFVGKPVAVMGASPGGFGTVLSQNGWLPILRTLKSELWSEGRMLVSRAGGLFDEDGNLTDDRTKAALRDFVAGFSATL